MSHPHPVPPAAEEQLVRLRKVVDSLRGAAAGHVRPEILERSHPAVQAVTAALDRAMAELEPLGFASLGDTGAPLRDGTPAVSRVFRDTEGMICGWVGFARTKTGPRLLVFLVSERPGGTYCTTLRNGTALSLARTPAIDRAVYDGDLTTADLVARHRERASSPEGTGGGLTSVATLSEAIELMERLHQARMTWRASCNEEALLRADLTSVLAHCHHTMEPPGFRLLYGHAATWLDFHPDDPVSGGFVESAATPLSEWLASGTGGRSAASESDWLFHCEFPIQGRRLQVLDVVMAGNDGEGVIIEVPPGVYVVEACVLTDGTNRRISRVRVHPKGVVGALGKLAGKVGVDLAAVAICDVDRLAPWARDHEDDWQKWGQDLWYGRTAPAGLYECTAAGTVVPFLDSGHGDGTYPVYLLVEMGTAIGLEVVFLSP